MTQCTPLVRSVRRALMLGVAGTAALAGSAFAQAPAPAQQDEAKTLDAVTITGTRIRRVDTETASPVFTIDAAAIERTGAATIGDFLQEVPSIAGAATNPTVNNGGGDGAATVSLRGLGDQRTLTLLNGRRMVYNDVNSIPMSAVARVEILKDGASAIYGSDAIGGVVNFILKRDFDGGEVSIGYGESSRGDGERQQASATFGISGDRGNVLINLNYNDQKEIAAADRAYSADALTLSYGTVTVGGSSRAATGRYVVPTATARANGIALTGNGTCGGGANTALTRIAGRAGTSWSDFRCFSFGTDAFNYQRVGNLQLTPQERAGLFVSGRFDVTDAVTAYAEVYTQNTRSYGQIAPLPFDARPGQDDFSIPANSFYNPFGTVVNNDLRLRLVELGNRRYAFNTDVKQITGGFEGAVGETSWSYDAGVTYGRLNQEANSFGYIFFPGLAQALGPSFNDNGTIRCGTPGNVIANCVPVNFFGPLDNPTNLAALQRLDVTVRNTTDKTLKNFFANFSGELFALPAGTASAAAGIEYREEDYAFRPDSLVVTDTSNYTCNVSSEACTSTSIGAYDVTELYAEAFFPILADAPWAKSLNGTVGARWSDYSTFGSSTNWKLGLEWRPIEDMLVRGTVAKVFRVPTIDDLYQGPVAASDTFSDPCNGWRGAPVGSPQLVACQNVPTDGSFEATDTQLSAIKSGNPNLVPEEGKVFTYGLVYDPKWLEGFSTSLDFWRVYLNDTIQTYGTQNILDLCFTRGELCNLFSRDSAGEVLRLFDSNQNIGRTDTKGVDWGMKYRLDDTAWGSWRFSLDTTYIAQFDVKQIVNNRLIGEQFLAGTFLSSSNGGLGNYSRIRALGSVNWSLGNWDAQWSTRFVSGFSVGAFWPNTRTNTCADAGGRANVGNAGCIFERGGQSTHNLAVGYKVESWNTRFQVGVDNVSDKDPPLVYQNNGLNGNTDERTYDTIGRYYWATASVTF